jgi:hypothetical protein
MVKTSQGSSFLELASKNSSSGKSEIILPHWYNRLFTALGFPKEE